jgi:hypothetical protein
LSAADLPRLAGKSSKRTVMVAGGTSPAIMRRTIAAVSSLDPSLSTSTSTGPA